MKNYLFLLVFFFSSVALATDSQDDVNKFYSRYDANVILEKEKPISAQEHKELLQIVELRKIEELQYFNFDRKDYLIVFDIEERQYSIAINSFDIFVDDVYVDRFLYGNDPEYNIPMTFENNLDRGVVTAACKSSRIKDGIVFSLIDYRKWTGSPCVGSCIYFNSRVLEIVPHGVTRITWPFSYDYGLERYSFGGLGAGFVYYDYDDNFNGQFQRDWDNNLMPNDSRWLQYMFTHELYPYFSEERILEGMRARGWCASEGFDLQVLEQEYADYDSERRRDIGFLNMILSELPLNRSRVTSYNNIAYYLEQSGHHDSAIHLLEKIIKHFPDRIVAYINLGDAYWGLEKHTEAREAYQNYIRLMRENNREQRIPKRVFDRVGD